MADTKISDLVNGTTVVATDRIPVARSPFSTLDNRYVTGTQITDFVLSAPDGSARIDLADTSIDGVDGWTDTVKVDLDSGTFPTLQITSTATGQYGPHIQVYHNTNGSHFDQPSTFSVYGKTSTGTLVTWYDTATILVFESGEEFAEQIFQVRTDNALRTELTLSKGLLLPGSHVSPGLGNISIDTGKGFFYYGDEILTLSAATQNGINYIDIANAIIAENPVISAKGDDNDIGLTFSVKGSPAFNAVKYNLGASGGAQVVFESTATGNVGPTFAINHNSASPLANDYVGILQFNGNDSGGAGQTYASIWCKATNVTAAAEAGQLEFYCSVAGSGENTQRMGVGNGVIIGTGTTYPSAGNLYLSTAGATVRTNPTTVGSLTAAATAGAGARAFVTDANATTFASIVATGGSNGVPVYSDGTNWRIG